MHELMDWSLIMGRVGGTKREKEGGGQVLLLLQKGVGADKVVESFGVVFMRYVA